MSCNTINSKLTGWDKLSHQEREVFLARGSLDLIEDLYCAGDDKGLEVFCKNLKAIWDFAEARTSHLSKKISIADNLKNMMEHLQTVGIDSTFAEGIDDIAALTTDFLSDTHEDGSDGLDNEQAVENIKALMQKEQDDFEAAWNLTGKSA